MFKLLPRRLWGISTTAFLLAFSLAALLYWLLPQSRATHHWSFPGILTIVGYINHNSELLIKQLRHDGYSRYTLNLQSGKVTTFVDPDTSKLDLVQSRTIPFQLSLDAVLGQPADQIRLIDYRSRRLTQLPTGGTTFNLTGGGFAFGAGRQIYSSDLSTAGGIAMTPNEQWLLLTFVKPTKLANVNTWIKSKTGWNLPGNTHTNHAALFNLATLEVTRFELPTRHVPCYEMHPDNRGFAVTELHQTNGVDIPADLTSTITWYTLPPASPHHSRNQWLAILATFLVPILVSKYRSRKFTTRALPT